MIELIIKSYFTELFIVALSAFFVFISASFFILRRQLFRKKDSAIHTNFNTQDFDAIAGENVLATQLDLARAYLETDHKQLAKEILLLVINEGSFKEQQEAKQLLSAI